MIRHLYRDLISGALALIPWNLLAAGFMLCGGLIASASGPGAYSYAALLGASALAGIAASVLFRGAVTQVEQGRVRTVEMLRHLSRPLILRGAMIGLVGGTLPVLLIGQIHLALSSGEVVLLAAAFLAALMLLTAVPIALVFVPALCAYPDVSPGQLMRSSLATIAAAPGHHVKSAALVILLGAAAAVTIAPMFTIFIVCCAVIGARLVVVPLVSDGTEVVS